MLVPVIEAYLNGQELTPEQVVIMRAYLRQWIMSPAWDQNAAHDAVSLRELGEMRDRVGLLQTTADIHKWLDEAMDMGIDPL